ncbi:hypothetical protein M0Q97_08775 [Candidatus Dojkabacteria bacterium]|nr:hypothetical protein [Candidatus Dojkabacteria bacterium]
MAQKNSFITLMEQISLLNKNSIEIISKLNDVVGSNKSSITVNYQENDGSVSKFELPTVGWLKNEIDIANSNIKKLTGLEGDNSVIIIDEHTSRKIQSVDINRDPTQISNINTVSNFKQSNNWFFESLINPSLSVEIDLSNQVDENINKVLSRRYIIKFEKDDNGNLTTNGTNSKTSFEETFLNSNNFTINEFQTWLNNPTNLGVVDKDDINKYMDEQYFDINYKQINYKGYFSVLKLERDTINNKVWYHLNTLNYYDRNGNSKSLAVGDKLVIASKNSYTKYQVNEVNTSSSLFRIAVERIEGYDPIPIGNNVLEYYSTLDSQKKVNITIGFDEYLVLFLKPINTDNNIIGREWSRGMSFYTNDLVLDTDTNVSMPDFYISSVEDYGALLKDLVKKKIPSQYGTAPNIPNLITDNFQVVQINKHLTDTKDFKTLKKLHSQKNASKSKLTEIDNAITEKNMEIQTKNFKSVADKSKAQNELNKLISKQVSETKLFTSYVNQITNSRVEVKAEPKFRVRGFWDIPEAIIKSGYRPQEIIGFEIQYRYSSKLGAENTTDGFQIKSDVTNINTTNSTYKTKTGYFSQWIPYKTDIRKRSYNESTGEWYWDIEDVSDADTPNINQLDIPIQRSEKVEIRIRSISEVGYPDAPLMSEWSQIITKDFPDELNEVLGENEFILKEATQEEIKVQFENELSAKGVNKHVSESFYVNEQYFGHIDKSIATSFKDTFGNTLSLFDYLKSMNDRIKVLEESIKRAKGELKVTLFKGTQEISINNSSTINIVINAEDYMTKIVSPISNTKVFQNNVYFIGDYYIQFENVATENDLGLLTFQSIIPTPAENAPSYIYNGFLYGQYSYQYINLLNQSNIEGTNTDLYGYDANIVNILKENYKNIGYSNTDQSSSSLVTDINWTDTTLTEAGNVFGATIHPNIESTNITNILVDNNNNNLHIIEPQSNQIIPLEIYFKPNMKTLNTTSVTYNTSSSIEIRKKAIKFKLQEESSARTFEFTLVFKFIPYRQFAIFQNDVTQNISIQ